MDTWRTESKLTEASCIAPGATTKYHSLATIRYKKSIFPTSSQLLQCLLVDGKKDLFYCSAATRGTVHRRQVISVRIAPVGLIVPIAKSFEE